MIIWWWCWWWWPTKKKSTNQPTKHYSSSSNNRDQLWSTQHTHTSRFSIYSIQNSKTLYIQRFHTITNPHGTQRECVCVCLPFHHHHKKNIETGNKWMNEKKTASHLSLANTHTQLFIEFISHLGRRKKQQLDYIYGVCARFIQVVFVIFVIVIISLWDFKTMNLLGSLLTEKWINGVVSMVNNDI